MYIEDNLSNVDEVELEEEVEGRVNMFFKKLFKIKDVGYYIYKGRLNVRVKYVVILEGSFLDFE